MVAFILLGGALLIVLLLLFLSFLIEREPQHSRWNQLREAANEAFHRLID